PATFKVGDKAVCPAQGVAEVVEVVEKEIAGKVEQFYVLRVLDSNMKVMIPVRNAQAVRGAVAGVRGIVHLAAVSRVIWAERDPELCWNTNVGGALCVLCAALDTPKRPWILFASSREVYGQPTALPAAEDAPLAPVNVYGRAKVESERLVASARDAGLRTAIVRLSNVYGSVRDHVDRVVPAFARAAVWGRRIRLDGREHTFDFTHIDDVVRGLLCLIALLDRDEELPPVHLLTGRPTTLGELAATCVDLARTGSPIVEAPPRSYDVARFYGDPTRARELLGWTATIPLRLGLDRLIRAFLPERPALPLEGSAP
ncbi:MAG: NAD-dependent epimerase/dehydratase family protein, partial [Myxococcota bacterium]|nr:NAD-dependent epimerase/dehydratase family protein [Myxococcota bacterium]